LQGQVVHAKPPSWMWFEPAGCWGTTMPLTRDSPSTQGDVPGPDPARAPPNKAIAQAGLACRGQPAGVYLASQGPPGGAPLPPRAGMCLVHDWATPDGEPTGTQRSPAVRRSTVAGAILGNRTG
jgi:hypothetical protein